MHSVSSDLVKVLTQITDLLTCLGPAGFRIQLTVTNHAEATRPMQDTLLQTGINNLNQNSVLDQLIDRVSTISVIETLREVLRQDLTGELRLEITNF